MLIRRGNIGADAQVIFVEDHAVLVIEGEVNLLPRAEVDIARQQDFHVVVAVALSKQIGVVAKALNHFTVKGQYRPAAGVG